MTEFIEWTDALKSLGEDFLFISAGLIVVAYVLYACANVIAWWVYWIAWPFRWLIKRAKENR